MTNKRIRKPKGEWCDWTAKAVRHDCFGEMNKLRKRMIRARCPICKRRMKIATTIDEQDGCNLYILPIHKVKG